MKTFEPLYALLLMYLHHPQATLSLVVFRVCSEMTEDADGMESDILMLITSAIYAND
jgi:hypothetical protein